MSSRLPTLPKAWSPARTDSGTLLHDDGHLAVVGRPREALARKQAMRAEVEVLPAGFGGADPQGRTVNGVGWPGASQQGCVSHGA